MNSWQVVYLEITPVSTQDSTQDNLDFQKNITTQGSYLQKQSLNNQLNDFNFFLYKNVQQKTALATTAALPTQFIAKKPQQKKKKQTLDKRDTVMLESKLEISSLNWPTQDWTEKIVTLAHLFVTSMFCLHKTWIRFRWKENSIVHGNHSIQVGKVRSSKILQIFMPEGCVLFT